MLFDKSWPVLVLWERRRQNNGQARGGEERRTRAAQETREAQGTETLQETGETRGTEAVQGMREAQGTEVVQGTREARGTEAVQETQDVRHAAVQLLASDLGYTVLETDSCADAWELFCERADFSCVILIPDEKCGAEAGVPVPRGSAAGAGCSVSCESAAETGVPVPCESAAEAGCSALHEPAAEAGRAVLRGPAAGGLNELAVRIAAENDEIPVFFLSAQESEKMVPENGYGVSIIEAGDGAGPGKTGTHGVKLREGMRGASGGRSVFSGFAGAAADYLSARIQRYIGQACPKFLRRLIDYAEKNKYAWHTPGHMGGAGFLRAPAGAAFYKYFGKNTLRSDLSVSVAELGSLLDHSGVTGEAEQNSAEVFGADRTYYVLNGTSSSNQIIWSSQVGEGDLALLDRNCHKSLSYAVICTGARPLYMIPRRSRRGLIGPVPLSEFTESVIKERIEISASAQRNRGETAEKRGVPEKRDVIAMMALTNSTYDGLCYNVRTILDALPQWVQRVHFDEAWFAYAAFHPIYRNHFGLIRMETEEDAYRPLIFCSQSTHKLLTALSQSSMLHIRNGSRLQVNPAAFNEAYMMYASTSPQYSMIASLDTATEMMKKDGFRLSHRMICGAVELRKELARRARRAREAGENRENGKNGESRQGTERKQADFGKSSERTQADFGKSPERKQVDFGKSSERKQEDFRRNGNNWAFGI